MKKIFMIFLIIFLFSCYGNNDEKIKKYKDENAKMTDSGFNVIKLFTIDGITVYKFYDSGYWRYFAKNIDGSARTMTGYEITHDNGKTTTSEFISDEIQTVK